MSNVVNDYLRTLPQYLIPKKALTFLAGLLAGVEISPVKNALIRAFIRKFKVNMQEALQEKPEGYYCFNDFFIRHLKPGLRPIAPATIVSPVDGVVSELGRICEGQLIQAKGRLYGVAELLACDSPSATAFLNGHFATLYLAPKDYHRIHMPMDAVLEQMTYVPGRLFSVQPATARVIPKLFAKNERLVVLFETAIGRIAMVFVGATIVGAIGTSWAGELKRQKKIRKIAYPSGQITFKKGDETGYFKLGSTVVLLFENNFTKIDWAERMKPGASIVYGEALGDVT